MIVVIKKNKVKVEIDLGERTVKILGEVEFQELIEYVAQFFDEPETVKFIPNG